MMALWTRTRKHLVDPGWYAEGARLMNLIFMGPPGAGKGTQAKIVSESKRIPQISTGEILRAAVEKQSSLGIEAKSFMDSGGLVPDSVVIGIIQERIKEDDCKSGFILDGFPRTIEQAEALDELLDRISQPLSHIIYFDVPDDGLIERLLSRAKKEGRADDNIESIKKRLSVFKEKTQPLIEAYNDKGIMIKISGVGSIDEIAARVTSSLVK